MVEGAFCNHCVHSWPHGGLVLSPFTQGVAAGNLCSGGILFTGNHFKRVGDAMSACNIRFVITSDSLLHQIRYYIQRKYLWPVINNHFLAQQREVLQSLK